MTRPLDAAYYADQAVQRTVPVVENVCLARDTYRVRIVCPQIARRVLPGQFVMLRLSGLTDPLIARPLALYDTVLSATEPKGLDIVYLVKGKLTRLLSGYLPGQELEVWGPLGNGFPPQDTDHLIMVAGGIGQTPFLALAREAMKARQYGDPPRQVPSCSRVSLCYGARTAELLAGVQDFESLGVEVHLATEDGTRGHHGRVTDLLPRLLDSARGGQRIVCCGPDPMMRTVAELAARGDTPCQVSLETPMACGIGICFSCVVRVRDETGGWDYKRTCVDGPVFDAAQIDWNPSRPVWQP